MSVGYPRRVSSLAIKVRQGTPLTFQDAVELGAILLVEIVPFLDPGGDAPFLIWDNSRSHRSGAPHQRGALSTTDLSAGRWERAAARRIPAIMLRRQPPRRAGEGLLPLAAVRATDKIAVRKIGRVVTPLLTTLLLQRLSC